MIQHYMQRLYPQCFITLQKSREECVYDEDACLLLIHQEKTRGVPGSATADDVGFKSGATFYASRPLSVCGQISETNYVEKQKNGN